MPGIGSQLAAGFNAVGSEEQPLGIEPADSITFPQWGTNSSGNVVEAANATQKKAYIAKGYSQWFDSESNAKNFWSNFWSEANSNEKVDIPGVGNPLTGIDAIGDFFSRLTEANTWIRVGKVVAGGALLIIGIAHITGMENKIGQAARSVPIIPV